MKKKWNAVFIQMSRISMAKNRLFEIIQLLIFRTSVMWNDVSSYYIQHVLKSGRFGLKYSLSLALDCRGTFLNLTN